LKDSFLRCSASANSRRSKFSRRGFGTLRQSRNVGYAVTLVAIATALLF
jgi:hypothetical protein